MTQKSNRTNKPSVLISICLLLVLFGNSGCGFNKFWRSYEQKPFDSQKWRDGDAQERGTMFVDMFKKRIISGKTKDEVLELLGEPDKRSTDGSEVWHYKVEFAGENPMQSFPVTFDRNGKAAVGAIQK